MTTHPHPGPRTARSRVAHGISLIFSLLTLAALSLAAVALIRSVDTGAAILGNMSFRQNTTLSTDEASRQVVSWLAQQSATALQTDQAALGYVASNVLNLDVLGTSSDINRAVIDWTSAGNCSSYKANSFKGGCYASAASPQAMPDGYDARYFIMRVCSGPGDPITVSCARPLTGSSSNTVERGALGSGAGQRIDSSAQSQYFRVLVRVQGARKTVTYTETLVHF
jgi:hypothetical protein